MYTVYRFLNLDINILRGIHTKRILTFPLSAWAGIIAVVLWISSFSMQVAIYFGEFLVYFGVTIETELF